MDIFLFSSRFERNKFVVGVILLFIFLLYFFLLLHEDERQTGRQTDRETKRKRDIVCTLTSWYFYFGSFSFFFLLLSGCYLSFAFPFSVGL